jgi:hypothetical protein
MNPDTFTAYSQGMIAAVQAGKLDWQYFALSDLADAIRVPEKQIRNELVKHYGDMRHFYQAFGIKPLDKVSGNQRRLLAMSSQPRPNRRIKLGQALVNYTRSNSKWPEFSAKIRQSSPHWFVDLAIENKKLLLKMARNSEPRPSRKTKLGKVLCNYTYSKSSSYDAEFNQQIRQLAPSWFRKAPHTTIPAPQASLRKSHKSHLTYVPNLLISHHENIQSIQLAPRVHFGGNRNPLPDLRETRDRQIRH